VEEAAGQAQADLAVCVDHITPEAVVVVAIARSGRRGLGPGVADGPRGGAPREGAVRPLLVVELDEAVEHGLQLVEGGRLAGLGA
jgi:hypothetical protein